MIEHNLIKAILKNPFVTDNYKRELLIKIRKKKLDKIVGKLNN